MLHSLAGRAENAMQARILAQLRDDGPLSRVQLADRLNVSRTTIAAEVGRLAELGLAQEVGPAASRGGRRSTLVDLSPRHPVRRASRSAPRRCPSASPTAALTVLADRSIALRHPPGTGAGAGDSRSSEARELLAELGVDQPMGAGIGVPGPGRLPPRGLGLAADHAGLGRLPGAGRASPASSAARSVLDNDVNVLAVGEQHAGVARAARDFLFVKIGTGIGCGIVVDGELYRGVDGCAGDIGHIRVEEFGPTCACGNTGCLEAFAGGAALARDATAAARGRPLARAGRAARRRRASSRPPTSASRSRRVTPRRSS